MDTVSALLDLGASTRFAGDGPHNGDTSPRSMASKCVRHNADTLSSALHVANWFLHIDVVILLRRRGADICELNIERDLPLHDARAANKADTTILHNAMTYKAGLNILSEEGMTNRCRALCQHHTLTPVEIRELTKLVESDTHLILQKERDMLGDSRQTVAPLHRV